MSEKLEQQNTNLNDISEQQPPLGAMITELPIREKVEVKLQVERDQTLLVTNQPTRPVQSASSPNGLYTATHPGPTEPIKRFSEVFVIPKKNLHLPSSSDKQFRGTKRCREDDDAEITSEDPQKRSRSMKERVPLTETSGNARDSAIKDDVEHATVKIIGQLVENVKDSNQLAIRQKVQFGDRRLERVFLHHGTHGPMWKNVWDDAEGYEVVCLTKEFHENNMRDFRRELNAYRRMWFHRKLQTHVPEFLNYSKSRRRLYLQFIRGRPYSQCNNIPMDMRARIAKIVKRIIIFMLEAGVAHGAIETENIIIRDGIETCPKDKIYKHVVIVGFTDAVSRSYDSDEEWEAAVNKTYKRISYL